MKLVWSPETASKAFIDTVKSCKIFNESSVAELISAMAAGWNAQLVVETWQRGGSTAASIGLVIATQHSGGRHICIVPDEESKAEFVEAMRASGQVASVEVVVGQAEEAMEGLEGIDFLVVDCRRKYEFARILRLGHSGAVLICKNAAASDLRWRSVLHGNYSRIVRSVFLPVGNGLDIVHVGASGGGGSKGRSRWIKHIDTRSGEEIVIRK